MKNGTRTLVFVCSSIAAASAHSAIVYQSDDRYSEIFASSWMGTTASHWAYDFGSPASYSYIPDGAGRHLLIPETSYADFNGVVSAYTGGQLYDYISGAGQYTQLTSDAMGGSGGVERELYGTGLADAVFSVTFGVDERTDFALSGALSVPHPSSYIFNSNGFSAYASLMESGAEIYRFEEFDIIDPSAFSFAGQFVEGRQYQLIIAAYAGPESQEGFVRWDFDLTTAPAAVPVPAAFWLFGSGLLGLAGMARRRA